jgi:prepilin-type N-terminal cleavage/methylation domain-containing protein
MPVDQVDRSFLPRIRLIRSRGFSLIELLVVCALLATIMGIGAAFLGSLNRVVSVQAERARLDSLIREAHNFAASEDAVAWLILDPDDNIVSVRAMTQVGVWHFEDESWTGFGPEPEISVSGARLSDPDQGEKGKIGRCLVFEKGRGSVDLGRSHLYNSPHGISVEAWVFPTSSANAVLFEKGGGLRLSLGGGFLDGTLRGVGAVSSRARNLSVPEGRWTHVKMIFDGSTLQVLVNGAVGDVFPPPKGGKKKAKAKKGSDGKERAIAYEPDRNAPLTAALRFTGWFDEVRVASCLDPQVQQLDASVAIDRERTTDLEIRFAPGGWLDPEAHESDVRIVLTMRADPSKAEVIEIGRLGTVR